MSARWTTISCRAFALAALIVAPPRSLSAADTPPPRVPLAAFWSVPLSGPPSVSPVRDSDRVFVALTSAHLTARAVADGHELWSIPKNVTSAMAVDGGLLFVAAADAIEALRGQDGASAWLTPRITTVAPLVARDGWVIAVTETDIVAIRAKDGDVAWRHPAGGVRLAPAIDGELLYTGADDGRVLALKLATGEVAWEHYVPLGVTALAAHAGRVYAGAGDKQFYSLDGRSGRLRWPRRIGSIPTGRIFVDDQRVYFAALDNIVYALDGSNGNQRWTSAIRRRPLAGVVGAGHVIFVPAVASQLVMLYDHNGQPSGAIALPSELTRGIAPDVQETPAGINILAISGGLANDWQLTFIAAAGEAALTPFSAMTTMPGEPFLTDPELQPIGRLLGTLVLDDPVLLPLSAIGWPVFLRDPPLEPLTVLPGLPLRPLSPVFPIRRGA